jgi:radical SAM protein with 4Fe4S-binding SPASM domain
VQDSKLMVFSVVSADLVPLPKTLKIEISSRCNLACRFCGRAAALEATNGQSDRPSTRYLLKQSPRLGTDMSLKAFQQLVDDLPQLEEIDIQGVGEPLINPAALEMIRWAGSRKIRVTFTTNGTLISKKAAEVLVSSTVRQLTVSVDGATPDTYAFLRRGSSLQRVVNNIQRLVALRNLSGSSTPRIRLAMVLTSHNILELPGLIELASRCGADVVTCSALKPVVPGLENWLPDEGVVKRSIDEAANLAVISGVSFECEVIMPGVEITEKKPTQSLCIWPWLSAMVTVDGYITPCCYVTDPAVFNLGNLRDQSFSSIWAGPTYREFRRQLREGRTSSLPCRSCFDYVGLSQTD